MSTPNDGLSLLCALFDGVTMPGDEVGKGGGRVDLTHYVPGATGPIADPAAWLERFLIPITMVPQHQLGSAAALFQHVAKGGEFISAEVMIPLGSDINCEETRWTVWHEIGHAADYVSTREEKRIATPHGLYSTKHIAVLRQHQEVIIKWSPHPDRAYKCKPQELWAECVACAIVKPEQMPEDLFDAVAPEMKLLHLPVPMTMPHPATDLVSQEEQPFPHDLARLPITIATIFEQLGGLKLTGALVCTGTDLRSVTFRHPKGSYDDTVYGDGARWEDGGLHFTVGLVLGVNGKPGESWRIAVTYEPDDTYSVWVYALKPRPCLLIEERRDVYGEDLCEAVIRAYDEAIEKHNGGFIPLG